MSEAVSIIYEDMINNPDNYGLPLIEDIEYGEFNPKANDSFNSSKRLLNMLNNISKAGELADGYLVVSKEKFNFYNKSLKAKDKLQNVRMLIKNLQNFGFVIDAYDDRKAKNFTVAFPGNKLVINALKGYLQFDKLPHHVYSMHYYFADDEDHLTNNRYSQIFTQYLDGDEKGFFICFNEQLIKNNFSCRSNTGYGFTIEYRINKDDVNYLVRCYSEEKKLKVALRLRKLEKYQEVIKDFSTDVKSLLSTTTCKLCNEKCNHRFTWEFEGCKYSTCVYDNFILLNYDKSAFKNIDEYIKLLCLEREFN